MSNLDSAPKIAVIIPSYNSERTIQATLRSVLAQDLGRPYEVIVADSSTDSTPELIRREFPQVRLLHQESRMQSGTARNLGVGAASAEILAFTDSDCLVPQGWLHRLVTHHTRHPEYAAVGGPIANANPRSSVSWAGYLAEFNIHLPHGRAPYETDHIPTSNISYKRWVFERYGGFPGNDVVKHVDLLFNHMLHSRGERLLCDPNLPVAHHHRARLGSYLGHQCHIGRGTVQAMRRLPDIQGSWLARFPSPGVLLLPGVTLIKFLRNSARFVAWSPRTLWKHPLILPLFALGLVWWCAGFAYEVVLGERCQGIWYGNQTHTGASLADDSSAGESPGAD